MSIHTHNHASHKGIPLFFPVSRLSQPPFCEKRQHILRALSWTLAREQRLAGC